MNQNYDEYLQEHKKNVATSFEWMRDNLPVLVDVAGHDVDLAHQICFAHDQTKTRKDEYDAYNDYFYVHKNNRSFAVVEAFDQAFLRHIHRNPHHWQHWILPAYDDQKGERVFRMPYNYILEMVCDWWSFSWKTGELGEIFNWYKSHEPTMRLHPDTKKVVEDILDQIKVKLEAQHGI